MANRRKWSRDWKQMNTRWVRSNE